MAASWVQEIFTSPRVQLLRRSPVLLDDERESKGSTASTSDDEMESKGSSVPVPQLMQAAPAPDHHQYADSCWSPISTSFTHKLRPFLDAVDRLRNLGVSEEGIRLPTIVVVGDQSSGKSSVLESLSGIELPKGHGIVTRLPLVLRLHGTTSPYNSSPKITLSHNLCKEMEISEEDIPAAISAATVELAGPGKAIANTPITLDVCRPGAPDLTLIDLPGITRVPVDGQPEDIFDKIKELILKYIRPEETIILNVLNAAMDFAVCESIRMSRQVDKLGKRTLAVVTKVDMCPDGLLQKITDDAVKIGLGYICVRNRTTKEASFQEAKLAEERLFSSHPELKKLSKAMVGIEALANRLVQLQTQTIADVLPKILKQIDSSLDMKKQELQQLSSDICTLEDASVAFFKVSYSVKKSLEDVLLSGHDCTADLTADHSASSSHGSSAEDSQLNYSANLHRQFGTFAEKVTSESAAKLVRMEDQGGYLGCIQRLLSECLGMNLPNVVPQAVIEKMVRQLLDSIASTCSSELPSFVHDAARKVVFIVVAKHAGRFPKLKRLYTGAFQKALSDCKSSCFDSITRLLEMEKAVVYTTSAELYSSLVTKLVQAAAQQGNRIANVEGLVSSLDLTALAVISQEAVVQAACSILAYWNILSRRLADQVCHELRFSFTEASLKVAEEVVGKVVGGNGKVSNIEEVMAEQPEVAHERLRLRTSIDMLSRSRDLVSQVLADASSA